ncbi:MAG: MBL fold metallo-hydrolase [Betaproteobacteria bacterium]|nr:MBL fold metallo-hydrolase [Betaproteobacteria bacterium]
MTKPFASRGDMTAKTITFSRLSENAWAFTAEGDPNSGVVIGDDSVMVIDAQATPIMAQQVIKRIRDVTDKPIKYVVLSHYHAVRVLGASGYNADSVIASRATYDLIVERGEQDWKSEYERFPRLFQNADSVPGLTWPDIVFENEITVWMGKLEVRIIHAGRGHTQGDSIVWLPSQKVLFSGDLVEYNAGVYAGDAHFGEWPETLEKLRALKPEKLVPGRGPALTSAAECETAIRFTQTFVRELYACAREGVRAKKSLKDVYRDARASLDPAYAQFPIYEHCMPFDVSRAYDEASGIAHPRIWTAQRDIELWKSLEI